MPGPYPTSYDSLIVPTDGVTNLDAAWGDPITYAVANLQTYVGLAGDAASSTGTLSAKIAYLLTAPGGIFKQTTAPSSPSANDLWIDTSAATRPLAIRVGTAWPLVGANALQLQSVTVHTTTPTDGQVLTYDLANTRWAPAAPVGGLTNPFIAAGDTMYAAPTTFAPTRLPIGTVGQILAVSAGTPPLPTWITSPYLPYPSGTTVGSILVADAGGVYRHLDPGTTGYALTSNGAGATPTWQAVPVTPPGASITAPAGLRVGSLIQYDGSAFIAITPGTAGQYLTAHGDSNTNPAALLTWTTSTALVNPMGNIGSLIYGSTGGAPTELLISATNAANKALRISGGVPAWATLGGVLVDTYLGYTEQAADPTAVASNGLLYTKTDHHLYYREAGGTVHDLLAAGTGYSTIQHNTLPLTARAIVNLIDGSGMRIDVADNVGATRTDVTIIGRWSRALAFA